MIRRKFFEARTILFISRFDRSLTVARERSFTIRVASTILKKRLTIKRKYRFERKITPSYRTIHLMEKGLKKSFVIPQRVSSCFINYFPLRRVRNARPLFFQVDTGLENVGMNNPLVRAATWAARGRSVSKQLVPRPLPPCAADEYARGTVTRGFPSTT